MLDMKRIRQNPQALKNVLKARCVCFDIDELLRLDDKRRKILSEVDEKKTLHNTVSKRIGIAKKKKTTPVEMEALTAEIRSIGDDISKLEECLTMCETSYETLMLSLPNFLHESVPVYSSDASTALIRSWGTPRPFLWEPKSYKEIGQDLNIRQIKNAPKSSTPFPACYCGLGARLERSIVNFFLDLHCKNGCEEIFTFPAPNEQIASALYHDTILDESGLPIHQCTCFAGSESVSKAAECEKHSACGVELNCISAPEQSYTAFENVIAGIETVLQQLSLPYRIISLCASELPFSATKTCDIEVWMPSKNDYVRIATCSNHEDFLARRSGIRFKDGSKEKPQYVHTISASFEAADCTAGAILENHQNEDGSVSVPDVLIPYMGTAQIK